MKLADLVAQLGCHLEGDGTIEIRKLAAIDRAAAGELTFCSNPRYRAALGTTRASAVIVAAGMPIERQPGLPPLAALRSANPYLDFARAMELFHPAPHYAPGIHPTAVIAANAKIGPGAHVGPYCFIDEDVEIGRDAVLHSFVTLYRGARIGDHFFA